eukprot:CAMPEP_0185266346 /NCGR_PEP_ID=MMETSP1359-20130426/30770_1 /TAXON_ID=552665 /ORGANISM="Bigelowiella longifila, Strain CCMP242" /LENGTH=394 /DNA_ID=CAMNT_0027856117 /DNA_START=21 /DNA_END=1205 /DNA_ORIENTATION=-
MPSQSAVNSEEDADARLLTLKQKLEELKQTVAIKEGVIKNLTKRIVDSEYDVEKNIKTKSREKELLLEIKTLKIKLASAPKPVVSSLSRSASAFDVTIGDSVSEMTNSLELTAASARFRGESVDSSESSNKEAMELRKKLQKLRHEKNKVSRMSEMMQEQIKASEKKIKRMKKIQENMLEVAHYSCHNSYPNSTYHQNKLSVVELLVNTIDLNMSGKNDIHMEILVVDPQGMVQGRSSRTPEGNLRSPLYILIPPHGNETMNLIIQLKHKKLKRGKFKRSTFAWTYTKLTPSKEPKKMALYKKNADFTLDETVMVRLGGNVIGTINYPERDDSKIFSKQVRGSLENVIAVKEGSKIVSNHKLHSPRWSANKKSGLGTNSKNRARQQWSDDLISL